MEKEAPVVRAEGVWFAYRRENWVIKGVSLAVPGGAFWAVIGPSGSGKTTLLKVLGGFLRAQRGEVKVLGQPPQSLRNGNAPWLRNRIGYIPQQLGLVRGITTLENVLLGSLGRQRGVGPLLGLFPKEEVERAREWLALLGIDHKAGDKVFHLSGGERQRVAIARTLLQGPSVILADEFVADLDLPRAAQVLETMRELGSREGLTFVMNLHEVQLVQMFADYAIILKEGTVIHQGLGREVSWQLLDETLR